MKPLLITILLFSACSQVVGQSATLSCSPKVDPETCQIASQSFLTLTHFPRQSSLHRITILDQDSYKREVQQYRSASHGSDLYYQVLTGPYRAQVLFERDGNGACPTSAFLTSDILDDNAEMVLDEKGQPKIGPDGKVTMRQLRPTRATKAMQAFGIASFLDGYSQACESAVMKLITESLTEKEQTTRK